MAKRVSMSKGTRDTSPAGPSPMRKFKSEPAYPRFDARRASIISQHFDVDPATGALRGAKKHEANVARTVHDWFNVAALIPICILNAINWKWGSVHGLFTGKESFEDLWTGAYFDLFFFVTLAYFVIDVLWVIVVPKCVASPIVIIVHHAATLLYLVVPFFYPEYQWLMGACLSVEVNTWFLIARRVFNKDGKQAFTFCAATPGGPINVKFISIFFYITWVVIRLVIYPVIYFVICVEYGKRTLKVGTLVNAISVGPVLQAVLVGLNVKWSYDLLMSKMKSNKGKKKGGL